MDKLLDPKRRGSADLREKLKDNEQFKEFQRKKAEFDAEQAAIMGGQGATSNVASNITTNNALHSTPLIPAPRNARSD